MYSNEFLLYLPQLYWPTTSTAYLAIVAKYISAISNWYFGGRFKKETKGDENDHKNLESKLNTETSLSKENLLR